MQGSAWLCVFLLLDQFSRENLFELRFEEDFVEGDQNFNDKHHYLRNRIFESNAILNLQIYFDGFVLVQADKIIQLCVYDIELFSNEFFEKENIFLFIYIVQTIDVRTQGSTNLPSVGASQGFQTISVWMDVLELSYVDQVPWFHQTAEHFEVASNVRLLRAQVKLIDSSSALDWLLVN